MRLALKIIFTLFFVVLSGQSFAWTSDYVSAFKPVKKVKSFAELQKGIKKDFQLSSVVTFEKKKKITGLMEEHKNTKSMRAPADI